MSRKPTIKLSYPDASTLAMQLTDAMIRRAPGKRVLETTSEDKAGDGEGSLLDGLNSVRTSTGVEMTLTLEPNSMDYALEQLIRPNLTEEEKKAIFGETENELKLETPDQEKQIEIGKIADVELRNILTDMIVSMDEGTETADAIDTAVNEINHRAGVIELDETAEAGYSYKTYALFGLILATIELLKPTKRDSPANTLLHYLTIAKEHLEKNTKDAEADFLHALHIGWTSAYNQSQMLENARGLVDRITERLYDEDHPKPDTTKPSWDDVEKEARQMQASALKQSAAPRADEDKTDETNETDDIEPGLLNDLDDGSDGMAPAEEVMGHDE